MQYKKIKGMGKRELLETQIRASKEVKESMEATIKLIKKIHDETGHFEYTSLNNIEMTKLALEGLVSDMEGFIGW